MKDLFGADVSDAMRPRARGKYQTWRACHHYRDSLVIWESCRTCSAIAKNMMHGRTYYKCIEMGTSNSEATDIRLRCVCDLWRRG
jgi:hypothetical protein